MTNKPTGSSSSTYGLYCSDITTTTDWYTINPTVYTNWNCVTTISKVVDDLNKRSKKTMKIFDVIIADTRKCEILKRQHVIAKDEATARLEIELTPEERKQIKEETIEIFFNEVGSFIKAKDPKKSEQ